MTLADLTWRLDNGPILNDDSLGFPFTDIEQVTGFDSAQFRETIREHEGVDGGFIDAEFESGREIIFDGTVYGDVNTVETYLDTLKQNFAPRAAPVSLVFKIPGVNERVIFVKPRGVRYKWDQGRRTGTVPVQFLMYAEDPRFYDNVLTGVSVPFGGLATTGFGFNPFYDRFGRVVSNGWGSSDTSDVWTTTGGAASDFSVGGGIGVQQMNAVNTLHFAVTPSVGPNFDIIAAVAYPVNSPAGANITDRIMGRVTDTSNYYAAQLSVTTAGNITLQLGVVSAGTFTGIGSAATVGTGHVANDVWFVEFAGWSGGAASISLRAKAWKSGTAIPSAWAVEGTDATFTTGSNYGLAGRNDTGNTDPLPKNHSWSSFLALEGFGFNLSFGAVVPVTGANVVVSGNRPTPAIITIPGPCVNPRIINVTDGHTLDFLITLGASDSLAIDLGNRTVTLNGVENHRNALQQPDWWLFNPGTTNVIFGGGSSSGGPAIISFRNAWR